MRYSAVRSKPERGGFSLVELIVVIGIIIVILSILLSAMHSARERANQTVCASQLHNLGIALETYAVSNHGWLPAWSGWHVYPPGSPGDDPGIAWTEELMPYYVPPNNRVYTCPSFGNGAITYFIAGRWSSSQGRSSMKLSEIALSSKFVLSGDNTNRHLFAPPYGDAIGRTTDDVDQDDANSPCVRFPGQSGGFLEHSAGNNILFGDMHVAAVKVYNTTTLTFDPTQLLLWEEIPQPSPSSQSP